MDRPATILKPMLNNTPSRGPSAVDAVFHALAEPTRRALVERLSSGPLSVSDLARPFDLTLAAIVQHLQVLEQSGLVRTEKVGRVRTCRVEPAGLHLAEHWLAERRTRWERRLDRLGELLDEPGSRRGKSARKSERP
jgi:DNA-binding transcriptional ArsR family regulator